MISREDIEAMQESEIDYMYKHYDDEPDWLEKCTYRKFAVVFILTAMFAMGIASWL